MQAKKTIAAEKWKSLFWLVPLGGLLLWQRALIWRILSQLFLGILVAFAAWPIARTLERKLKRGLSAALALFGLIGLFAILFLFLVPSLVSQAKQIAASMPGVYAKTAELLRLGEEWLAEKGVVLDQNWKTELLARSEGLLKKAAMVIAGWLQSIAGNLGKWMLTPVFAFYLLRDRREISEWVLMLFPSQRRGMIVHALREMRRETIGYLRAQLMISAVIGLMTAIGLLLCGIPAWLLLGVVMAVLELIPYIGPLLGGIIVALFSWQRGLARMLWALGVVILVQQLEGNLLSPKLTSEATRLHPLVVLLGVLAGGSLAGVTGILLAVPVILCCRAILQVITMERMEQKLSFSRQSGHI